MDQKDMPPKPRLRLICAGALLVGLWLAALNFTVPVVRAALPSGPPPGVAGPCDFVLFWAVGRMEAVGQAGDIYDPLRGIAWERAHMAAGTVPLPFQYPPPVLLLFAPAQALPLLPALLLWNFTLGAAAFLLLRMAGLPRVVSMAACCSPAALLNFGLGQFGMLTGALLLAGLATLPEKPGRAGLLAGMLVIKPQAGLLMPVALLAARRWRALVSAAAMAALICGVSVLISGWRTWQDFFAHGGVVSRAMLMAPFPAGPPPHYSSFEFYGISVLWMFRSLGFGFSVAAMAQACTSAVAIFICWRVWRAPQGNSMARVALTMSLTSLCLPFGYLYDLCGCSAAFAALAWQEKRLLLRDMLLWVWPVAGLMISLHLYLELAPVVLALAAHRAFRAL